MKDKGFTLIETLIVIAMIGILSAIAAPSWLNFVQQRRLNAATEKVIQSVVATQSEAKKLKRSQFLSPVAAQDIDSSVTISYPTNKGKLEFDYRGTVPPDKLLPPNSLLPYRINIFVTDSSSTRCVVVKSLFGAIIVGKNANDCNKLSSS